MKFYCISDYESSVAFRLANISTFDVRNRTQAIDAFKKIIELDDAGIILITDRIASLIQDEIKAFTSRKSRPLILQIASYGIKIKADRKQNGAEE